MGNTTYSEEELDKLANEAFESSSFDKSNQQLRLAFVHGYKRHALDKKLESTAGKSLSTEEE